MSVWLTPDDLRLLRERLEAQARALRGDLASVLHRDDSAFGLPNHLQDIREEAVAQTETNLDVVNAGREAAELEAVDDALRRIAKPGFGHCADCGQRIARERLFAEPAARRCLVCERRDEALRA